MSKGNERLSVFDIVSKQDKKSKKQSVTSSYSKAFESISRVPGDNFHPERDFEASLAHYEKLHDEINKKIDDIYKTAGISPEASREQFSSSKNFSREAWKELQELKKALAVQFQKMLPMAKQATEGKESRKKTKGSFSKRKSWISID
jgi:hypothetical protein